MKIKDQKQTIIDAFISIFNQLGYKVTLDKVASKLHIAKKTIYKYFTSKEEIYEFILNNTVDEITENQKVVYFDKSLSTKEKLYRILTIETTTEANVDMSRVYELVSHEPIFGKILLESYEKHWQFFILLVDQGKLEKILRPDVNARFLVGLLTNGMEMVYRTDFLRKANLTYTEAIKMLASTVLEGFYVRE
ncbi:MAG: TetR/AcrR family transcriptional regulator [Bacilli bacterium]